MTITNMNTNPQISLTHHEDQMVLLGSSYFNQHFANMGPEVLKDTSVLHRSSKLSYLYAYLGHHAYRCYVEDIIYPSSDDYYQQAGDWAREIGLQLHFYTYLRQHGDNYRIDLPYELRTVILAGECIRHVAAVY